MTKNKKREGISFNCKLPKELHDKLVILAQNPKRPLSYVARDAFEEYIERHLGKDKGIVISI
jgi:predicted transcriptional regulator